MLLRRKLPALLLLLPVAVLPAGSVRAETQAVRSGDVTFMGAGGVTLHGTIIGPQAAKRRSPAIVMVHGAGPVTREEYRDEAEAYARRGVVTLIYDKRTDGYSTVRRDYAMLATDALAAVRALRARPEVDPDRVGVWGLSEGGWVAPLAAARSADVAFLIVAGAVGTTPARQQAWAYGERLRHAGIRGSLVPALQRRLIRYAVAGGLFGEAAHDPVRGWEHVRQPVLAVWGTLDREAVPAESAKIIAGALARGGNEHYTIRFIAGARHNLNGTRDDGFDRPDLLPPTYATLEASWIKSLAGGPPPIRVGSPPPQAQASRPVDGPLAWYEAPQWQLVAFAFFVTACLGYPIGALVRRGRGRRGAPVAARPARVFVVALPVALIGFLAYLGVLILTGATVIGPVVLGRSVPWLLLQLLSVTVVAAGIATGAAAWRSRRSLSGGGRIRLGLLLAAAAAYLPWALYWGLVVP
ncbi:prolyl oligopeptidase family serine peptidase [Nonomuraea sp. NPDC050540]|uniref:prolyl oligopeptidase family serine peptidase n=1 Tax=Nonomuraea sp. NPDC050540 TaxID=3364367 RepID=UPI0037A463D6